MNQWVGTVEGTATITKKSNEQERRKPVGISKQGDRGKETKPECEKGSSQNCTYRWRKQKDQEKKNEAAEVSCDFSALLFCFKIKGLKQNNIQTSTTAERKKPPAAPMGKVSLKKMFLMVN